MYGADVTAAAILTGGQARRFHGQDKSRLVVDARDGRTILERQLALAAAVASEVLVVTSTERAAAFGPDRLGATRLVLDHYPAAGPLGAILTALDSLTSPQSLLVLAADMPGVSRRLIDALITLHGSGADCDATVPQSAHGLEPLAAIYAPSAAAGLRRAFESGERSLQRALPALRLRVMPPEAVAALGDPAIIFRNINRPGDL